MEKVSNRDICDITVKANLSHAQLQKLFDELDIDDTAVEKAKRNADTQDFQLQANKVLKEWRTNNGRSATRKRIIDALIECRYTEAKEILEEKWGLVVQGKYLKFSVDFFLNFTNHLIILDFLR